MSKPNSDAKMPPKGSGKKGDPLPVAATQASQRPKRGAKPIHRLEDEGQPAVEAEAEAAREVKKETAAESAKSKKPAAKTKAASKAATKPTAKTPAVSKAAAGRKRGTKEVAAGEKGEEDGDDAEEPPPKNKRRARTIGQRPPPDPIGIPLPYDVEFRTRESLKQLQSIKAQISQEILLGPKEVEGWLDVAVKLLNSSINEFRRVLPDRGPMAGRTPDGGGPTPSPGKSPKGRKGKKDDEPKKPEGPAGDNEDSDGDDGKPSPGGQKNRAAKTITGRMGGARADEANFPDDDDEDGFLSRGPDFLTGPSRFLPASDNSEAPKAPTYTGKGKGKMSEADELNGLSARSPKGKSVSFDDDDAESAKPSRKRKAAAVEDDDEDNVDPNAQPAHKKRKSPKGKGRAVDGPSKEADAPKKNSRKKSPSPAVRRGSVSERTRSSSTPPFVEPPLQDDGLAAPTKRQTRMTKPKDATGTAKGKGKKK